MQITLDSNLQDVRAALLGVSDQLPYATMLALNKTALQARSEVQTAMKSVFDRPTEWVLNSVGPRAPGDFATKTRPAAYVAFADVWNGSYQYDSADGRKSMVEPHVWSGRRHYKAMEVRLLKMGLLPEGYNVVPGGGASIDANGNMSRGQITQLLNVLGTYTEGGYNVANSKTASRLAKGNKKKNTYGFVYWVNKVGGVDAKHLLPGVYQRVITPFGSSLKPVLIFVKQAKYKARLDFFGIVKNVAERDLDANFREAFKQAVATGKP